jgi:hypothetical protein
MQLRWDDTECMAPVNVRLAGGANTQCRPGESRIHNRRSSLLRVGGKPRVYWLTVMNFLSALIVTQAARRSREYCPPNRDRAGEENLILCEPVHTGRPPSGPIIP